MAENAPLFRISSQPPLIQLIISLIVIVVAGLLAVTLLILAGTLIFNTTPEELLKIPATGSGPHETMILKYVQVSQQVALFLIPSLIIARLLRMDDSSFLMTDKSLPAFTMVLVIFLAVLIIPFTTWAGYINSEMDLPDRFAGLEIWMKAKEDQASELTSLMITSSGVLTLSVNVIVLAVIPAISEEFLFRGVFQQLFGRVLRSPQAGIWISAIIFSTIHFQFYGFLPRVILGLLFGYLFYWTANIWISVIAHFANNSLLILVTYINEFRSGSAEIINGESVKVDFPFISVILCCLIIYLLWDQFRRAGKTRFY